MWHKWFYLLGGFLDLASILFYFNNCKDSSNQAMFLRDYLAHVNFQMMGVKLLPLLPSSLVLPLCSCSSQALPEGFPRKDRGNFLMFRDWILLNSRRCISCSLKDFHWVPSGMMVRACFCSLSGSQWETWTKLPFSQGLPISLGALSTWLEG